MSYDLRVTKADGTARAEINITPDAHIFVRRSGVPIDPVDAELLLSGSEHLDCNGIRPKLDQRTHIKFVDAIGAVNILRIGRLLPVYPDVGPIVDALEVQPVSLALVCHRYL